MCLIHAINLVWLRNRLQCSTVSKPAAESSGHYITLQHCKVVCRKRPIILLQPKRKAPVVRPKLPSSQGGYVFACVCLSVSGITKNVFDNFLWNLLKNGAWLATNDQISVDHDVDMGILKETPGVVRIIAVIWRSCRQILIRNFESGILWWIWSRPDAGIF